MTRLLLAAAAGAALAAASARWTWWRPPRRGVPVLMYHKIGHAPRGSKQASLWVTPAALDRQCRFLAERGYTSILPADLASPGQRRADLKVGPYDGNVVRMFADRRVVFTFDDGYRSVFTEAFPILRKYNFVGAAYLVTDYVGLENGWHDPALEPRVPLLTWEDVATLAAAGWEIGSHGRTHRSFTRLSPAEQEAELVGSRAAIAEHLGRPPASFAYPYGDGARRGDGDVPARVGVAGYRLGFGILRDICPVPPPDPMRAPRVFVRGDDSWFDFRLALTRGRSRP